MKHAMNKPITDNKIVTMFIGAFILGGLATMFGMYRAARRDGNTFLYG